jgi:hypothetical protein
MAEKDRNEIIQELARVRVRESMGALSPDDALKVATAQVDADEEAAKTAATTDKKKAKAS